MKIRFLVPGTSGHYRCGGLLVELQTARLLGNLAEVDVVTYRRREADYPFLDDLLSLEPVERLTKDSPLWILSWGFDVPRLLRKLRGRAVAYHAHSAGYGFDLPAGVPVLAVSRNTLGYWGDRAPRNPLFLLPNALEPHWLRRGARQSAHRRSIDVLVQSRKTSSYVLERLVPALINEGLNVHLQSGWVDDLVQLFNDSSVYLYDSADYWHSCGVSEGFGLPPIEALACGCVVFSSLNHALADLLDPGHVGHQIGSGTLQSDLRRIKAAVSEPDAWRPVPAHLERLLAGVSEQALLDRWKSVLSAIQQHWEEVGSGERLLHNDGMGRHRWGRRLRTLQTMLRRRCSRSVV